MLMLFLCQQGRVHIENNNKRQAQIKKLDNVRFELMSSSVLET